MGISGSQKALMYAQSGVERSGATRSNYHSPHVFVAIGGTHYAYGRAAAATKIANDSLVLADLLDDTPNTCQFTAQGFTPTVGPEVVVTLGSKNTLVRWFAGHVLTREQVYVKHPLTVRHHLNAIDYAWLLNHRKVSGRWTNVSATVVAQELIAAYASGFTTRYVETGLPTIDEVTFTNQDLTEALTHLAKRIGGYWYVDYHKDVHFFLTETGVTNPTALTPSHPTLQAFVVSWDLGQYVTRVLIEGYGSTAAAATAVGATELSVVDASPFQASGGQVVSGPQRIAYTGLLTGGTTVTGASTTLYGGSTTVAARPAPTGAPSATESATAASPTFGPAGNYQFKESFIFSDGSESMPSAASNTVNLTGGKKPALTNLVTGPSGVSSRRIYYSYGGGGTPNWSDTSASGVFHVLGDNTTTSGEFNFDASDASDPLTTPATYSAGSTLVYVNDTSIFSATGGTAKAGSQIFTYTGRSTSSGFGALTGIPAAGAGSLSGSVSVGSIVVIVYLAGAAFVSVDETSGFSSAGGTADVDGQIITYTGRSTTSGPGSLTGIPTSGAGSLAYPVFSGDLIETLYPPGSTSIAVADTANFSAGGGTARIGFLTFTYGGKSPASGAGSLTGIPATGAGALTNAIFVDETVFVGAGGGGTLVGIPASGAGSIRYAINEGDDVNLLVQVDDTAAQTALAALIGGDGIQEEYLQDRRISYAEAIARGEALLALRAEIDVRIRYQCRDTNSRAGRTIHVDLPDPTNVTGDFKIQSVRWMNFKPELLPLGDVVAASSRFSLEDLLRLARKAAA